MHANKRGIVCFILILVFTGASGQNKINTFLVEAIPGYEPGLYHSPDDSLIQYTGRVEKDNNQLPRFWSPGIYIRAKFAGDLCEIFFNDEVLYGNSHNYIEVIIDNHKPVRLQCKWKNNKLAVKKLHAGNHTITICKDTESGIGYLEFAGINCNKLLTLPVKPVRKIEFIGNSITCGSGIDLSKIPCGKGQWYDQHNAYISYGPLTSRALDAQWILSSVSGIGMIHSCCNMNITMPQVFDKINMRDDSIPWSFNQYIPDVVTICLGENDGIQDSTTFCNAYIEFVQNIRNKYPLCDIVCMTSPMGDSTLTAVLKKYLKSVKKSLNDQGDKKVYAYFFSKQYHNGCGGHPGFNEHKKIAAELTAFIKKIKPW